MENDIKIAMQFMLKLNEYQQEIIKSMNYIRGDIHELKCELKEEIDDLRQELRDYKGENNKRWEENDRRWEENNKRWEKYEANRKEDKKFLIDTLINYDILISAQLGDYNAEKMRKLV